jgi:hypothetical protein
MEVHSASDGSVVSGARLLLLHMAIDGRQIKRVSADVLTADKRQFLALFKMKRVTKCYIRPRTRANCLEGSKQWEVGNTLRMELGIILLHCILPNPTIS